MQRGVLKTYPSGVKPFISYLYNVDLYKPDIPYLAILLDPVQAKRHPEKSLERLGRLRRATSTDDRHTYNASSTPLVLVFPHAVYPTMALRLRDRNLYRADEKENHRLLGDDERQRLLNVRSPFANVHPDDSF